MTATRIDGVKLVYTYLVSVTALMAALDATTQKLYGPPRGRPSGISEPKDFIVFSGDGGMGNPYIPMADEVFVFDCYGATQTSARGVSAYLADALNRADHKRVTVGSSTELMVWGELIGGPFDLPEPELGWPRVVCRYRVVYGERIA